MSFETNNSKVSSVSKTPKVKYVLGESGMYFEPTENLLEILNRPLASDKRSCEERLLSLLTNAKGNSSIKQCEGRSLVVSVTVERDVQTSTGVKRVKEIKNCGFITHGNAKVILKDPDIADALAGVAGGISKAITTQELVSMF